MTEDSPPPLARLAVRVVLIAILVLLTCLPVFFSGIKVEGGAMLPSLADGTAFLLDGRAYGLRLPGLGIVSLGAEPTPGDVVVADLPHDQGRIVKRVIGVSGDRIAVQGQRVRRNGVVITQPYAPCSNPRFGANRCATETVAGRSWQLIVVSPSFGGPSEETTVPEGHVFLMGDHRDESNDSRNPAVGAFPMERVLGRAVAIYRTNDDGFVWRRLD